MMLVDILFVIYEKVVCLIGVVVKYGVFVNIIFVVV